VGRLYIPNSISLRNFDNLFQQNDFDFSDGTINVSFHPSYVAMAPVGVAFYAAIGDRIEHERLKLSGNINASIRSINYLQRIGLFNALGFADPKKIVCHDETGRFIPIQKIRDADELSGFIKQIDPILHTNRNNSRVIKHVFSEVLRNVLEHSWSPTGGNVCATYNRRRKKISIGISDIGRGLYASLKANHKVTSDLNAIKLALTPGITGATNKIGGNEENAGAGLFFTKCIAQSTNNHFIIYSGSAYFKLRLTPTGQPVEFHADPDADYCTMREGLPYFDGTLVGIDINIGDDTTFNRLIENIGNAYRVGLKKAKKNFFSRIKFT
jgi:anti-sigma regulatory factor (Ser/Thr protein kinase)